jgi:hypothetical protein
VDAADSGCGIACAPTSLLHHCADCMPVGIALWEMSKGQRMHELSRYPAVSTRELRLSRNLLDTWSLTSLFRAARAQLAVCPLAQQRKMCTRSLST